ncbi:MAG: hypothetical protein IPJ73_02205 [Zoogloea sp.]|nr:hypothetical protein [Zoogloea sp.]
MSDIAPDWIRDADEENGEAVERLLAVQRPRAAFACVHFNLETLGPELLFRLMSEMVKEGKDQPGHYQLDQYYIENAFALMDKSPMLILEQKAGLEFAYIDALSKPRSKRRKLWGFRTSEIRGTASRVLRAGRCLDVQTQGREDPPDLKVASGSVQRFAERYKLLEGLDRMRTTTILGYSKRTNSPLGLMQSRTPARNSVDWT